MITNGRHATEASRRVDLLVAGHGQGLSVQNTLFLIKFGLAYDQVRAEREDYAQRQLQLQWRTIGADKGAPEGHQGGTPVQMDKKGNIHKGPSGVRGKNIKQLDKDVAGTPKDKRKQAEPPQAKRPTGIPEDTPSLESMITDVRLWMGSGRANLEAEQEAMDRVGADSLGEFGSKLANAPDDAKEDVWRILKADQDAQKARANQQEEQPSPAGPEPDEGPPEPAGGEPSAEEGQDEPAPPDGPPPAPEPEGGGQETPTGGPTTPEERRRGKKHWDPATEKAERQARAAAEATGAQVDWDRVPADTWDYWAQAGLAPDQMVSRALQDGYGPDDSGQAGEGPEDRPTIPGADPDDAGGNFKLTGEQAEPLDADNAREAAEQAQRKLDEDYEYATASGVRNKGDDLKGSARHKANAWRSLAQAEADGTAEALTTRGTLEKAEPHGYSDWAHENPIAALAAHLAMRKFPAKPGPTSAKQRGTRTEEEQKKDREDYVAAYQELKESLGEAARGQEDPEKIVQAMYKKVGEKIEDLRSGEYRNRFNNTANALIGTYRALKSGYFARKTGVFKQLQEFGSAINEKYGESDPALVEAKTLEYALDVMESGGMKKLTGKATGGGVRYNESENYVKTAVREGGRDLPKMSPDQTTNHMVDGLKFRGIQFGNSMTDGERAHHATKATEAMMDLADLMGLDTADMSLGGVLGLAFGARGHGTALAHYEPIPPTAAKADTEEITRAGRSRRGPIINITRKGGVGALAHEWGHALDHQLTDHNGYMSEAHQETHEVYKPDEPNARTWKLRHKPERVHPGYAVRELPQGEMRQAHAGIHKAGAAYRKRLGTVLRHMVANKQMSKGRVKYWESGREVFARSFERWAQRKLQQGERNNTYLTGLSDMTSGGAHGLWPTDEEVDAMAPHFEKLAEAYAASEMRKGLKKEGDYAANRIMRQLATLTKYAAAEHDPRGRWITVGAEKGNPPGEQGGARVFIGRSGKIIAGPAALKGRNIKSLDRDVAGTDRDKRKEARPPTDKPERTAQQAYEDENDPAAIAEQAFKTRTNIWKLMREMGIRQEDRKRLGPLVAAHMQKLAKEHTKPSEMRRRAMEKRKLSDEQMQRAGGGDSPHAAGSVRHPRLPAAADSEYKDQAEEWRTHSSGADWHADPTVGAGSYLRPKSMAKEIMERPKKAQAMVKLAEQGTYTNGRFWVTTPEGLQRKLREMDLGKQAAKIAADTSEGTVLDEEQTEAEALRIAGILQELSTQGEWHEKPAKAVAFRDAVGRWDQYPVVAMQSDEAKRPAVLSREDVETISRLHPKAGWYLPWGKDKPAVAKLPDGTIVGATLPLDAEKAGQGLQSSEEGQPIIDPHRTRQTAEDLYEPANRFEMDIGKQHTQNRKPTIDIKGTDWGEGKRFQAHAQNTQDGWILYAGPSSSRNPGPVLAGPFDNKRHLSKAIEDLGTYAKDATAEGHPLFKPLAHARERAPEQPKPKAAKKKAPDASQLTPKLRKAIASYIGAGDAEDVSGFHSYVADAYKQHVQQTMGHNDQWKRATGLTPQGMRGLAQRAQRYEDVAQIPAKQQAAFGKLAGSIARDFPHLLTGSAPGESEAPEGNVDELLLTALKANGPRKLLDPSDEQILDAANEMIPQEGPEAEPSHEILSDEEIGSGGFDAPGDFGPEEEDFPESAADEYDDEDLPFSLSAADGPWEVIKGHLQQADEE